MKLLQTSGGVTNVSGTSANGTYSSFALQMDNNPWVPNFAHTLFCAAAAMGGATITVQVSPDGKNPADTGGGAAPPGSDPNAPTDANSRWFNLSSTEGGTITVAGTYYDTTTKFRKIRAIVSGATSATSQLSLEIV
jgi:hypothetical protein